MAFALGFRGHLVNGKVMNLPLLDANARNAWVGEALEAAIARVIAHGRFVNRQEISEF